MTKQQALLNEQVYVVKDFLVHYTSYRILLQNFDELSNIGSKEFWVHTTNSHFYQAINLWSMVFGTDNNETHWKKLDLSTCLKSFILSKLDISDNDYQTYWKDIRDWRNRFSAHRLPDLKLTRTPDLKMAKNIVFVYEEWLKSYDLIAFSFKEYERDYYESVENTIRNILK